MSERIPLDAPLERAKRARATGGRKGPRRVAARGGTDLTFRQTRFVKLYTNFAGRQFMRFEHEDGRVAEIRTRDERIALQNYTRGEARKIAAVHLAGQCTPPCPVTTCRAVSEAGSSYEQLESDS